MNLKIAIDGPVGSGKGAISKLLSKRLGLKYVETGALYRAVAYYLKVNGINHEDVCKSLENIHIEQLFLNNEPRTFLNGEDITDKLRDESIGKLASIISAYPCVREFLLEIQRKLVKDGGIIEGRDIGTVVLPDADVKIFLTAEFEERVRRKAKQWNMDYETAMKLVMERDRRDTERKIAPLKKADDAILIDTTGKTAEEVVEEILSIIRVNEYKVENR